MMKNNIWRDGMMGVVVGDALGCPIQFFSREEIAKRPEGPVVGMEGYGTYEVPKGTWTDDSSMAIATMASILEKGEINSADIMTRLVNWIQDGEYTPFGYAFDIGNTCYRAVANFSRTKDVATCGVTGEYANGNGALMRIMPACLYCYDKQKSEGLSDEEAIELIHMVGGLTHNHLRSNMCCGTYYFCVKSILDGREESSLEELLQNGVDAAVKFYTRNKENEVELNYLKRLFDLSLLKDTKVEEINSSGYVIDTIEAAFWSLLRTESFKACLLTAVNLGDDTDTVGAIAGGLAGLYYGYDKIPSDWLDEIKKREWIEEMCEKIH